MPVKFLKPVAADSYWPVGTRIDCLDGLTGALRGWWLCTWPHDHGRWKFFDAPGAK